jgi:hypothetical protein
MNNFTYDLCRGLHNMANGGHTYMLLLMNNPPSTGDTVVDTTTTPCTLKSTSNNQEIAAGNNYTKKGLTCGANTLSSATGTAKFVVANDPVWTATGAMATFQYVVMYNDSAGDTANRPVVGYWNYGSGVPLQTGETFTVDLDGTNGVLTVA